MISKQEQQFRERIVLAAVAVENLGTALAALRVAIEGLLIESEKVTTKAISDASQARDEAPAPRRRPAARVGRKTTQGGRHG